MSTATATSMKLTAEQESENARINAENERLRKQARAKRTISLTLSYVALALVTFLMIFPLIIVVIVSFTPNAVTQTWPPKIIPSAWTLDNYTSLFQRLPVAHEVEHAHGQDRRHRVRQDDLREDAELARAVDAGRVVEVLWLRPAGLAAAGWTDAAGRCRRHRPYAG